MMTRRSAVGALIGAGTGMAVPVDAKMDKGGSGEDVEAVARSYVSAWNAHDMNAMRATLASDAEWVNVVGMHWRGRDQIVFAHAAMHAGMFRNNRLNLKAISSRQLAPGVAVLLLEFVQDAYQVPSGPLQQRALDRLTLIVLRRPEGWRIVHGHNTIVDERAAPNDPVLLMKTK